MVDMVRNAAVENGWMGALPARRVFTTTEYHRMVEAGILSEDDRVELIDGEIVQMAPIGTRHASCVARLTALFSRRLTRGAIVWVQNPIVLDPHSEPQPDVVLVKPRADFYAGRHPRASDVVLVVEVMDTTAAYDRGVKLPLYARRGISEVWLVDLIAEQVEVYRRPALRGYRDTAVLGRGRVAAAGAFPRVRFRVNEILGA